MSVKFNNKQIAAILKLEEALKEIKGVGLRIQGMDSELELYKKDDYEQLNRKYNDSHRTLSQLQREELLYAVEDDGVYVGSGGW